MIERIPGDRLVGKAHARGERGGRILAGTVASYFADIKTGTIVAEDGQSYSFDHSGWTKKLGEPEQDMNVLVEVDKQRVIRIHAMGWRKLTGPQ